MIREEDWMFTVIRENGRNLDFVRDFNLEEGWVEEVHVVSCCHSNADRNVANGPLISHILASDARGEPITFRRYCTFTVSDSRIEEVHES